MKVKSVSVTVLQYPIRWASDSAGYSHPRAESMAKMVMLTVTADDRMQGLSFMSPETVYPFVVDILFRRMLVEQDPLNHERIWQDLNHWQRGSAHQPTERALPFVEQVLWDLIGHSLRMPVYKLFGGYRDTIPAYDSTMYGDDLSGDLSTPEEYAVSAEKLVAHGYKVIKLYTWMPPISLAPNPKMDIRACTAAREAVGSGISLMTDDYYQYSRAEVLWIGKALEELNFIWFEEPMEEDPMPPYAWLAENSSIPTVGPESFSGKHHMCAEWVKAGACDILCTGVNGVRGITSTMKVVAPAESFGMDREVHDSGAASLAAVDAIRNCRWYERGLLYPLFDYDEPAAYLSNIVDPIDDQGFVHLSQRPDLGEDTNFAYIEVNTANHG